MIRYRAAAITLSLPLLVSLATAHAQRVLPLDRPIVLPPVSAPELRNAERALERMTPRRDEKSEDVTSPAGRDNPALGHDVTSGIQERTIERTLPR